MGRPEISIYLTIAVNYLYPITGNYQGYCHHAVKQLTFEQHLLEETLNPALRVVNAMGVFGLASTC